MKLAFRCYYGRTDATAMCMHVANVARNLGCDIEFFPPAKPAQVHPTWDRYLVKNFRDSFSSWLDDGVDMIIYTYVPDKAELDEIKKHNELPQHNTKAVLLLLWDTLDKTQLDLLPEFSGIVCPAKCSFKYLQRNPKCTKVYFIPWDTGVPITFEPREIDGDRIGVIWPLDDEQAIRQDPRFLQTVEMMLECCPTAWLTITYSNSIAPTLLRDLRRVTTYADGRVELMKGLSDERQELLYGHHDLTLWPSLTESAPLIGLTSLAMGTPVIGFDHPIIGEVIRDGFNGVLVPCGVTDSETGVPKVEPDYPGFGRKLVDLVRDTNRLAPIRQNTVRHLRERRETFRQRWTNVLTGAE